MIDALSDPGSWADAIRFPPFIADERDGTLINHAFKLTQHAVADRSEGFGVLFHNRGR